MPNKHNPFYLVPYIAAPILYVLTRGRIGRYFIVADFVTEKEFKRELEIFGLKVVKTRSYSSFRTRYTQRSTMNAC